MLRSLRFQLPALFLLGVVVAGLVSAAIALRLFRSYAQNRLALAGVQRAEEGVERPHAALRQTGGAEAALAVGDSSSRPATASTTAGSISSRTEGRASGRCRRRRPTSASSGGAGCGSFVFRPPDATDEAARGGAAAVRRQAVLGDDRGREARDGPRPALARADRAAADRVRRRRARGGGVRLVQLAPDHHAGACGSRRPRTRSRTATTTSTCRAAAPARSASSPSGSARWPRGSARPRSSSATS